MSETQQQPGPGVRNGRGAGLGAGLRTGLRDGIKAIAGGAVGALNPQCRYESCIFILAHMRCGSTALSNILCSRPDVSGYGEAHVRYDGPGAPGRLVVNQMRRGAWSPRAPYLFDKILHSRHDAATPPAFFRARAVFLARPPGPAIRSIRSLYEKLGRSEYGSDREAAEYYVARIEALLDLWPRFPAERRVGLTHAALLADPEAALARISARLAFDPPLENRYVSPAASTRGGGGDPTASARHTRIEPRPADPAADAAVALDIDPALRRAAEAAYARFEGTVADG